MGFESRFTTPGAVYDRVLKATRQPILAHAFNTSFVHKGGWGIQLYRTIFEESAGGAHTAVNVFLPTNGGSRFFGGSAVNQTVYGVDIGRSKVRVALCEWDPTLSHWSVLNNGQSVTADIPSNCELSGIAELVGQLVTQLSTDPALNVCVSHGQEG